MRLTESAEWRTVLLVLVCYISLGLLILNPMGFHMSVQILLIIPLITLHSSLQHECIHGHPFETQSLNDALVFAPVGILLPYFRFKATHIKHHQNACISVPYEDPESCYQDADVWSRKPAWLQKIYEVNNTLLGRMLLGPAINLTSFAGYELKNANRVTRLTWTGHFAASAAVLGVIYQWGDLPVGVYLVCSYFGYSLLMVRTFLEHQAHVSLRARSVIIEDTGFFSYLFLNNNLHALHHAYPAVAWYALPQIFKDNREQVLILNEGYYFKSYWEIFKCFAFSQKEPVAFPELAKDKPLGFANNE